MLCHEPIPDGLSLMGSWLCSVPGHFTLMVPLSTRVDVNVCEFNTVVGEGGDNTATD